MDQQRLSNDGRQSSPLRGLYAITDEQLLANRLIPAVEQALRSGARVIQYRNKNASFAAQMAEASPLKQLCHQYRAIFLINDNVDLCQAVEADGVHLGQDDSDIQEARWRLGPQAIIGISCHNSAALASRAQAAGADYIAAGRFFPSKTKPQAAPATLQDLQKIRAQVTLPLVAIGGVTAENGTALIKAGADMLAVINYLFNTDDVAARASSLQALFETPTHDPRKP